MPRPLQTLRRRIVSIPAVFLAFVLYLALLPLLVPAALVIGALRRDRWAFARTFAMIGVYLSSEVVGLTIALAMWLASGPWLGCAVPASAAAAGTSRFSDGGPELSSGASGAALLRVEVEQWPSGIGDRQLLVFLRHASVLDTLLAASLIANPLRMHLLYVFKRESVGPLPRRGRRSPRLSLRAPRRGRERARGAHPARTRHRATPLRGRDHLPRGNALDAGEAQARAGANIEIGTSAYWRWRRGSSDCCHRASGGPFALLDGAPASDVIFIGHEGFEGNLRPRDIVRGSIVGKTIRVTGWKVDAGDNLRAHRGERVEWLYDNWTEMDAWLREGVPPPQRALLA